MASESVALPGSSIVARWARCDQARQEARAFCHLCQRIARVTPKRAPGMASPVWAERHDVAHAPLRISRDVSARFART